MAVDIKLKRSHTHSNIPTTSDLSEGEFAVNTYDGKMFMRDGGNNIVTVGSHYTTDYESSTKTFYVTVATSTAAHVHHGSGSSNKYKINGVFSPFLKLIPGITYRFDQSDSSNSGHPFRFYLDENKSTAYTTGVTTNGSAGSSGAYTEIVVSHSTPSILHYQCSAHGLMGWAAFVNTSNLTAFDTDNLSEGSSNLYYTTARVNSAIDSRVNASFINNLTIVADTATALANARNIGGVSFDGTADINLPGVNASGNQDTSGNAATATALETARNIHGVSFDGTGNIDLTEVIQDTVGAMFSSNTETNITATYQDSDGTIDLVVSASGIASVVADTTPQLGGNLDVNDKNITFGDASSPGTDNTLIFGDSNDLRIYHNGTHSFIHDNGAGQLRLRTNEFRVLNANNNETMLNALQNGAVELYHDNVKKFETTSTGVQTTGTLNVNGAYTLPTADGNSAQVLTTNGSGVLSFASVGSLAGSGIQNVSDDSSPQLGGNLDVVTHSIISTSNRDINITPNGSGKVVLDGLSYPTADGTANQVLTTDGSGTLTFADASGGSGGSGESVSWSVTQSSHGLAVGDVIYNNGTNYVKAQANATGTLGIFVVSAVANTNTFTATFSGKITLSSLTAGQYYFVSTSSAGDFTATEPTSGYSNPILFALSTTEAVVLPYRPQDLTAGGAAGARTALDVFSKAETNQQVSAFAIALG